MFVRSLNFMIRTNVELMSHGRGGMGTDSDCPVWWLGEEGVWTVHGGGGREVAMAAKGEMQWWWLKREGDAASSSFQIRGTLYPQSLEDYPISIPEYL